VARRRMLPAYLALFATLGSASDPVRLTGTGSTFIYPILAKWIREYTMLHPDIEVFYEPTGSGRGISRSLAGLVDFGASDGPVGNQQLQNAKVRILHLPVTLGAVVPAYNVPGVTGELRFTGEALAGIFLGKVKKWNDPLLARANPHAALPNREIHIVYRADSSGTTYVWADYLSKISPEWNKQMGHGTQIPFPVGAAAQYNEGVVQAIKETRYSLGYLQLTYAVESHTAYGRVENANGVFVRAEDASITAAAAATATTMPDDFRISITNAADADAYPISSFTWLLVPAKMDDPEKKKALIGFLRWVLTKGQTMATPLNYAPLPGDVALKVLVAVDRIH
jgi:phosphate transport system substrate-binding protein